MFALVIFGLSVDLIRGHHIGELPATLGFAAFIGGVSLLGAIIGIASTWIQALQGVVGAGIDAVLFLLNIIGGIVSLSITTYRRRANITTSLLPSNSRERSVVRTYCRTMKSYSRSIFSMAAVVMVPATGYWNGKNLTHAANRARLTLRSCLLLLSHLLQQPS